MSNDRSALVDALVEASGIEPGEFFPSEDQLDLLSDDNGRVVPGSPKLLREVQRKRGVGRPQGSRNKRTQKVADWFIQKYGDPLAVLGEMMMMPTDLLYQEMVLAQGGEDKNKKITGKDALLAKAGAARDALPYIHGKKPLSLEVKGKADAVIFMPGINLPQGADAGVLSEVVEKLGIDALRENSVVTVDGREIPMDELQALDADDCDEGQE